MLGRLFCKLGLHDMGCDEVRENMKLSYCRRYGCRYVCQWDM